MIQNEYIFAQITTTKIYYYFIVLQLVLTLILTGMIYSSQNYYAFMLQCILATFLSIDLLIKYFAQGKEQFAKSFANIIDTAIVVILLLLILIESFLQSEPTFEEFSTFILFCRYGIQLYRIGSLLKQSKNSMDIQKLEPISLDIDVESITEKFH